ALAGVRGGYAGWLALLWLALAWARRAPGWFTAFQAAVSGAILFAVTSWVEGQPWRTESAFGMGDPRALQAYGVGLGLLALVWVGARRAARPVARLWELWNPPWPSFDRAVLGALVLAQAGLAALGAVPGAAAELTPAGQSLPHFPAELTHASGPGGWLLLGVLAVALVGAVAWPARETGARHLAALGLLVLALTAPVLWAGSQ